MTIGSLLSNLRAAQIFLLLFTYFQSIYCELKFVIPLPKKKINEVVFGTQSQKFLIHVV